ncbi:MAG: alpha-glucosidase C-terminal domain-containing protein, partial [Ferruginibacter sp.]|nr:alpha-glucosidase C-terminal domain-containing protein [Chitinophagaceae bacterium]
LFSVNEKTGDARISGTLASLCGLETSIARGNSKDTVLAIQRILLMQAHSFFVGGIPVIFYGDEAGYTNDYSYLQDESKNYDNRWMHRPVIDWEKNKKIDLAGTTEQIIFSSTKKLIAIRKKLAVMADRKNLTWLTPHNIHVAGFLREWNDERVYCIFNFSSQEQHLTWYAFKENGINPSTLYDHWAEKKYTVKEDNEYFTLPPCSFFILEPVK